MPGFFCHHPNIQSLSHCRWQTILNNVHRITENICYNVFPENEQSESFRKMKTSDFFGVKFRCFASKVRRFVAKKSGVFDFRDYDWFYFTDYLLFYYFTSHILQCLPKMLYRICLLFLIRFTSTKIRTFFSNANKSWKTLRRKPCGWRRISFTVVMTSVSDSLVLPSFLWQKMAHLQKPVFSQIS